MIGRISGVICEKKAPHLLLMVNDIGYEIEAPMTTFYELPPEGEKVTLHTHFVVREDDQRLFGFITLSDRDMFRALIKTSGVGPKLALAILSGMNAELFCRHIKDQNVNALVHLPGIGKRTAQRLILEMHDRLSQIAIIENASNVAHTKDGANLAAQDAISALISLGYKPKVAQQAVGNIKNKDEQSSEALIRQALKAMA